MLRYLGADIYGLYEYKQPNLARVFTVASSSNVPTLNDTNTLGQNSGINNVDRNFTENDMNYQGYTMATPNGRNMVAAVTSLPISAPHVYHAGRVIADGNWLFHNTFVNKCLTFQSIAYAGSMFPAGSLRINNNKNGYYPNSSVFSMPQTPTFNVNSNSKPSWITRNYPDLNSKVYSSKLTQKDFATRFWLDRNESLMSVDAAIGQVINNLKKKNVYDNTLIIFTSDNGHMNGDFRLQNKQVAYESSMRVPLIIKLPKNETKSSISNPSRLVANIDIAPTILDYAGKRWDTYAVDGRSLRPVLATGIPNDQSWRTSILIERQYPRMAYEKIKQDEWGWGLADYDAIRTLSFPNATTEVVYKYIKYGVDPIDGGNDTNREELYNLVTDKYELSNIAGTNQPLQSTLVNKLNALKVCKGDSCRNADK